LFQILSAVRTLKPNHLVIDFRHSKTILDLDRHTDKFETQVRDIVASWISYNSTNGTLGGGNLIRVAVTRDISQAVPIASSFVRTPDSYLAMTVHLSIVRTSADP
jgi:hypothetical protein